MTRPRAACVAVLVHGHDEALVAAAVILPWVVRVAVAMRVHDVAGPQEAREGAAHLRRVEDLLNLRDLWQDVVQRVHAPRGVE